MIKINSKFLNTLNIKKIGNICFLTGIFFLASAVGISIIFFLISAIISFTRYKAFFKDKWNYPFILAFCLMIISTFMHYYNPKITFREAVDPNLSFLGLINWIPFFLCFWAFQTYLNSQHKRELTGKLLICGSIPVIFSGILQLLNINGPFQTLNGLIVWFQKPISDIGSLSGLFNNQNYAGLWMVMIWPFCLSELKKVPKIIIHRLIIISICVSFASFIFLTDSRNALLGLLISTPIVLGSSSLIWYLPTLVLGLTFLAIAVLPIFPEYLQLFMKSIIPTRLYTLFPEIGFEYVKTYPRINKWIAAISFICSNPLFGWGAASFPIMYKIKSGEWFGHAHNLPLELAHSYGIITSFIIFSTYILILFLTYKKIFKSQISKDNIYISSCQKAWFASSLIFFISHLVDIQYFDARISLLCWILLAGLKALLNEKQMTEIKQ